MWEGCISVAEGVHRRATGTFPVGGRTHASRGAEPFILWDNRCLEGTRSFGLENRHWSYTPARQRLAYTKSHRADLPRPNPNAPNPRWTSDSSRPEISATFRSSWVCSAHVDGIPRSVRVD